MKILLAHRCHDAGVDDPARSALPPETTWAAGALRAAGHQPVVANFSRLGWRDVETYVADMAPDLLVASCATTNRRSAIRLVRVGRRASPGLVTVLDGSFARALAPLLLGRVRELDAIVTGDALRVLPLACAALVADGRDGLAAVPGLTARAGGCPPSGVPVDLDGLPDPLEGLEAAGVVPDRDLVRVVAAHSTPEGGAVRLRGARSLVRELRRLRDEHGVLEVELVGPELLVDPVHLRHLADALRRGKCAAAWRLTARAEDLAPDDEGRTGARARRDALRAAERAGCRRVAVVVDAREGREAGEALAARLARASTRLREHGIAPHVVVRYGTPQGGVEEVALLRGLLRAFRPRSGELEVRLLHPGSPDWAEYVEGTEVRDDFWLADERDEIPAAPPRQVEVAAQSLEVTLRDACREGQPGPRDLEAAERRLAPSAWALVDWGDFRSAHDDLEEAERRYRAAADLEPWSPFPWLHLAAAARAARGHPELEAEALRAVLNRVPKHEASRERLARLRRRRSGAGGALRRGGSGGRST